jgi:hypothetical protein
MEQQRRLVVFTRVGEPEPEAGSGMRSERVHEPKCRRRCTNLCSCSVSYFIYFSLELIRFSVNVSQVVRSVFNSHCFQLSSVFSEIG